MARLGDFFALIRNGANIKQGLDDSGYPITRIETISNRTVDRNKMGYAGINDLSKYRDYILQDGDILMSHINSEKHLAKTALYQKNNGEEVIHGMNLLLLRPNTDCVISKYAFYYFSSQSFLRQIPNITKKSVNQASFTVSALKELSFPSVPLNEQLKIVGVLEKIDTLIEMRKQQLAKLDELVKARFVEMFGSLNDNKKGLDIVSIKDLCTLIKDGTHQTPIYTEDTQNGFKFLSSKDVMTQKICWDNIKYISSELHEKLYVVIQPQRNDILMSKNGVNYGVAAINDTDEVFDIYVSLALLRPITDKVNPVYLRCAINNPDTKRQFDSSIKGIGVPNLHLGEIKNTKVLLPSMEKQTEFVSFVEQVDKSKVAVQKALDEAQTLFYSLMQQYFG
mgnify:CR=1 FL=1